MFKSGILPCFCSVPPLLNWPASCSGLANKPGNLVHLLQHCFILGPLLFSLNPKRACQVLWICLHQASFKNDTGKWQLTGSKTAVFIHLFIPLLISIAAYSWPHMGLAVYPLYVLVHKRSVGWVQNRNHYEYEVFSYVSGQNVKLLPKVIN